MSTKGSAESYIELVGEISSPDAITGKSAYEIALLHGFKGTEAEWLASLKGKSAYEIAVDHGFNGTEEDWLKLLVPGDSRRIADVTLLASGWVGDTSPYSQVVDIVAITANSQVDLTPSVEQLSIFHQKDLAFVTENDNGVITVYAIGDKPSADYTIQATITEVRV